MDDASQDGLHGAGIVEHAKLAGLEDAVVDDAVELLSLLSERGVAVDPADALVIMTAAKSRGERRWAPEEAAAVFASYAKLAALAKPATLAGLRYARSPRGRMSSWAMVAFGIVALALIIWFQAVLMRISTVQATIGIYQTELDAARAANDAVRVENLTERLTAQYSRLESVARMWDRGAVGGPPPTIADHDKEILLASAAVWTSALGTYLLPALYGLLGSIAFMLRNQSGEMRAGTLTGNFAGEYIMRMVLGMVGGLAIGMFIGPDAAATSGFAALTPVALAFLAGYGVELLFGLLDRLVTAYSMPAPRSDPESDGSGPRPIQPPAA